jgi:hypothetical protein
MGSPIAEYNIENKYDIFIEFSNNKITKNKQTNPTH